MTGMGSLSIVLIVVAIGIAVVAAVTGVWRLAFTPFRIPKRQLTIPRLGLCVHEPARVERVGSVLDTFARGFNSMLTARTPDAALREIEQFPTLYRPFAEEGLAMGYVPRNLFRFRPTDFERRIVEQRDEHCYLHYVGVGFWFGLRNVDPAHVVQRTSGLDPLHEYLVFDGYGFARAFFEYPKNDHALERLLEFPGYARNAAFQGVGRAFCFLYLEDHRKLVEHIQRYPRHSADVAAGIGLASVFIFPDQPELARTIGRSMPAECRPHFHLGMCFGWKARARSNAPAFDRWLSILCPASAESIRQAIAECDRVEQQVRRSLVPADRAPKTDRFQRTGKPCGFDDDVQNICGYRTWRQRVTVWLEKNVEFPFLGLLAPAAGARRAEEPIGTGVRPKTVTTVSESGPKTSLTV